MRIENPKPLIFRQERLQKLSDYLHTIKRNRCFEILADNNYLFDSEGNPINLFPVFKCTIKALPKVFPESWIVNEGGFTKLKKGDRICCLSSIIIFFGLHREQFMHLFTPYGQDTETYGGDLLLLDATPGQIADNISKMVNLHNLSIQPNSAIKIFISKN